MRTLIKSASLLFSLLIVLAVHEAAFAIDWDGNGNAPPNGVFSDPLNWNPNQVPSGSDFVNYSLNNTYTVTFTGNQSNSVTLMNSGTVSWLSDSATVRQYSMPSLYVGGGQSLTIGSSTNPVVVTVASQFGLGSLNTPLSGTIIVDGANSALNATGVSFAHILGGATDKDGTLRYQNGAQGSFTNTIDVGNTANNGSDGLLEVVAGADLTTASLRLATTTSTSTGTVTVDGAGSTLVQSGASSLTVGSVTGGAGTIIVGAGGAFTTGSGLTTVNATGMISLNGSGVFNVIGNLLLDGGRFLTSVSNFSRAAGQSLTVQNGGEFNGSGAAGASGSVGQPGGTGAHGPSITTSGTLAVSGASSQINLLGGKGGTGGVGGNGGTGGVGGTLSIAGGTTSLSDMAEINLQGGDGGSPITPVLNGGPGGAGGNFQLTGGAFDMTGGRINLAGGAGGPDVLGGSPGAPGAPGSITVSGGMFTMSGGEVTTGSLTRSGSGVFNFNGGTLHAQTVNTNLTNNGGTLAPGNSAGTTTVNGNYTQSAGVLAIELGGTSAGQFDKLVVTGIATLGGALDVSLINGFLPQVGNSFDILDWGTLSGTFANVDVPDLGGGLTWNTSQLYTSGTLSVGGVVGDYNHNGTVDAADYVVWRKSLGQTGTGLAADGNFNNMIDAGDLTAWRTHFGQTAGSGSGASVIEGSSTVPEPTSTVMLFMEVLAFYLCRRVAGR